MFQSQQRKSKPSSSSSSSKTEPASSSSSSSFSSLASSSRHRQQQHQQQRQHQQKAKMNNTARYNQTCSLNGERVAAVMLSCCASPTTTTTTSPNDIGMDLLQIQQQSPSSNASTVDGATPSLEKNYDERKMRNGHHQLSLPAGGSGPSHRHMEKRRDTQDSSTLTPDNHGSSRKEKPQQQQSQSSSDKSTKFPGIGPTELIGMVPCGREDLSASNRNATTLNGRNKSKPFASSPLIDRGDSLVERQASLLSLMASDTMETAEESTVNENGLNNSSYKYSTPDSKRASTAGATAAVTTPRSHNPQKQQTVGRQSSFTTPRRRHVKTSAALSSETMLAPDSPAMELSMAKQFANVAQMSNGNFRKNNRETLRHYRSFDGISGNSPSSPTKKSRESSGGGGIGSSISVPNLAATGQSLGTQKEDIEEDEGSNNDTIERVVKPFLQFEDAPPPPLWSTITNVNVNSELVSTYEYPRLYLRDPTQIITGNQGDRSNNRNSNSLWWFHLAQRMETTLKHVQDDHWKALLGQQAQANGQSNGHFRGSGDSFSASASSSSIQQLPFGCVGLEDSTTADGCVTMSDLCLGQNSQTKTLGGGKSHRKNTSWSSHSSLKNRSRKGTLLMHASSSIDTTTASATAPTFQPSATPVNCWSEPTASTIKVRGKNYSKDGMKVESESSIFKVLGADSFVNNGENATSGGNGSCCSVGTQSFLERFRIACQEVGLDRPPFLLTINFIVPWGNFQMYLIRPDADEDPFSSHDRHSPSEKAWREFMERDKEYRNKRLKLIPRICAGPWMVKKMVGSTPALIGTKLPVSYHGSLSENYLEISLDVTKGPAFGNSVANTVVGKADAVTVDLGFVIEGQEKEHLPERMLGLIRLHHLDMKKAPTQSQWRKEVLRRR